MSSSKPDPCKNFACALQKCLQASDYQEWKCASVIEALYDCCAKAGNDSLVCSGIHPKQTAGRVAPLKFTQNKIVPENVFNKKNKAGRHKYKRVFDQRQSTNRAAKILKLED